MEAGRSGVGGHIQLIASSRQAGLQELGQKQKQKGRRREGRGGMGRGAQGRKGVEGRERQTLLELLLLPGIVIYYL